MLYRKSAFALKQENFKDSWRYYEVDGEFSMNDDMITGQIDMERRKRVAVWKEQGIGDQIICLSLVLKLRRCVIHYRYILTTFTELM